MKYLIPLYAVTLFVSAFLLFSVQPMVGKFLLPLLGGGPSVWNTAMLFFQLLLLAGYAYAHAMARFLKPQTQIIVHFVFFAIAALSLPLSLPSDTDPGDNPMLWQLGTMLTMAAAPFFILSSSAPLLQQWFARSSHPKAQNPYFLYAASNFGSMLALLSYPVIIEPLLRLHDQSLTWSWGYGLLGLLILLSASLSKFPEKAVIAADIKEVDVPITWKQRSIWLLLAFVPSSLMLGVTTFITTEVTAVPLFWVIPLALYLLTFIIAFSEKSFFTLPLTRIVQGGSILMLLFLALFSNSMSAWNAAIIHLIFFFFTALLCHQELAALKPRAKHLTEFFLIMSAGGALGGLFNSLLAPLLFKLPIEYMLVIVLSVFCRYISSAKTDSATKVKWYKDWKIWGIIGLSMLSPFLVQSSIYALASAAALTILCGFYVTRRWAFAALFTFIIACNPLIPWQSFILPIALERNYYGSVMVSDYKGFRIMMHGATNHGAQALDPKYAGLSTTYYATTGGAGDIFRVLKGRLGKEQKIAALGMGIGMVANYQAPGRHFDFYEINPIVVDIASNPNYFTYVSRCGDNCSVILGDARHKIAEAPDHSYDVVFVDIFSSDNIPMHVVTKQAVELYQKKLKPGGFLVFHISSRFFILDRELAAIAETLDQKVIRRKAFIKKIENLPPELDDPLMALPNQYAIMTNDQNILDAFKQQNKDWTMVPPPEDLEAWSDDYANVMRSLIFVRN